MTTKTLSIAAALISFATAAHAQLPGEPKRPAEYDPIASMRYSADLWKPNDTVRDAQRVLSEAGYYTGELDGVLTPQTRRAIWNFQKAQQRVPTGSLDRATATDLGVGSVQAP